MRVLLDLEELRSGEAVAEMMKQEGISKSSATRFQVDLEQMCIRDRGTAD